MLKVHGKQIGAVPPAIYLLFLLFLICLPTSAQEASNRPVKSIDVKKSENDNRQYRYLELENSLRVLLISDPVTEKSAAALDVAVGANQNPRDREGLAHFLEHMLFLGTEKYPTAGEYQEFVAQHGGSYNAYTAAENTNYFFDIDNAQLEPALDRFAQFFVAPLFSPEYVERERNAVHSEYLAKLKDDGRRRWDIYREIFNQDHPGAKFSVGNLTTLADRPERSVRDDMLAFYNQYYSANLMSLVILGRQSLDELETMVRPRFSAVANRNIVIRKEYPPLFANKSLPASLDIKPEKELRQLSFVFPIPSTKELYKTKPYSYIAHLIAHEGEGSLLSLLKRLGWADALYATTGMESRGNAVFEISIQLTPQGVRARKQIISLVFHCIDQLRERGIANWRYNELQVMAELNFRYQEKLPPMETASQLAQAMSRYEPEDILTGAALFSEYDEKQIQKGLSYLRSDNVLVALTAPEVEVHRISRLYAAPYALRTGIPELLELKPTVRQELRLPEKNLFIPKRLVVKKGSMLEQQGDVISRRPELILSNKNIRVWYTQDREFIQPRAAINLRINSPLTASSAAGAVQAQLFSALINDQLNEFAYPAKLAGIEWALEPHARGFDIKMFGYSGRQGLMLNKVMKAINSSKFKEERFLQLKENLLRNLRNQNKDLPYQVLAKQLMVLQTTPAWSNAQLIAALEPITFEKFNKFTTRQLLDARIDAFFHGNYFRAEALKLAVLAEHGLLQRQAIRDLPASAVMALPADSENPFLYAHALPHADKVVELFIQSPSASVSDNAHMLLIRQLALPAFHHQLRTEKQLGYIVHAALVPLHTLENVLFIVQSPSADEEDIIYEINEFLAKQAETITNQFTINRQSLINELREPARSLKEQSSRYWNAITNLDGQFGRRLDLAEAVARITPESLSAFYRAVFMDQNRRLWLTSKQIAREDYIFINDITAYKEALKPVELN